MGKPVFLLCSADKILAIFEGLESLVEALILLGSYITAEIYSDKELAYADIKFLDEKILEKYKIEKQKSYRLSKVLLPSAEQILIYRFLHDEGESAKINNVQIIKKPS